MRRIKQELGEVLVDLVTGKSLKDLDPDMILGVANDCYAFLGATLAEVQIESDHVVVVLADEKPGRRATCEQAEERGLAAAGQGNYVLAVDHFRRAVQALPDNIVARRNLAMCYVEMGQSDRAKQHIVEVLRLNPNDPWTLLLGANLFMRLEKNLTAAARLYDRAYQVDPSDPHILTGYAALYMEIGEPQRGREMFEEAIAAQPQHPNSYLGLAMMLLGAGQHMEAAAALERMFLNARSDDPRSLPVFGQAREVFGKVQSSLAGQKDVRLEAFMNARRTEIEEASGHNITVQQDLTLKVPSKVELAWKYARSEHRIIHSGVPTQILPHHIVRAIEQIAMATEAQATRRNQTFQTTAASHEKAMEQIGRDVYRLRDLGLPESAATQYLQQIIGGVVAQLYNGPLDMAVELRVHQKYPLVRPHQFVSLQKTMADNVKVAGSREIKRSTPPVIYNASLAMNYAYALFADNLWNNATAFAHPYPDGSYKEHGRELFSLWQEAAEDFSPGDEFDLMKKFAGKLHLDGWFELIPDDLKTKVADAVEEYDPPTTDQKLLKERDPATMMYLVGALKRFAPMSDSAVQAIATEIGILGMRGITFTDPDKRYELQSLPGEEFSGLQLLALMYVAWRRIDPTVDTGLNFGDIYESALKLYESGA